MEGSPRLPFEPQPESRPFSAETGSMPVGPEPTASFATGPEPTIISASDSSALSHSPRRPYEGDYTSAEAAEASPLSEWLPQYTASARAKGSGAGEHGPSYRETADRRAQPRDLPIPERPRAEPLLPAPARAEGTADASAYNSYDHAVKTIESGFAVPAVPIAEPLFHPSERVGTSPLQRTPATWLVNLSREPELARLDQKIAGLATAQGGAPRETHDRLLRMGVKGVLGSYGVPRDAVKAGPAGNFEFPHKGNIVDLTIRGQNVEATVFDHRTSQPDRERIKAEHHALLQAGASLEDFHRYLQTGRIPSSLSDMTGEIEAHRDEITAAFAEHAYLVHGHAVENGYRHFSVNAPSGLRHGLPLAVHLAEQPVEVAEAVLGAYSPTRGFVHSPDLGLLVPATRFRAATPMRLPAWRIDRDGALVRVGR